MEFVTVADARDSWVRSAGSVSEAPEGKMKSFSVQGKFPLVANPGGIFCAMESRSTHRGKDLSEGKIVIYPYRARFDVTNGKLIAAPRIGFIRMKTTTATAMSPGWTVAT